MAYVREPAPASPVELLHRPDQADRSLLDEISERQTTALIAPGHMHHQPQIRLHHAVLGPPVAALHALGQRPFLVRAEQGPAAELGEEHREPVDVAVRAARGDRRCGHCQLLQSGLGAASRRSASSWVGRSTIAAAGEVRLMGSEREPKNASRLPGSARSLRTGWSRSASRARPQRRCSVDGIPAAVSRRCMRWDSPCTTGWVSCVESSRRRRVSLSAPRWRSGLLRAIRAESPPSAPLGSSTWK